jgi:hypothetical protein
MPSLCWIAAFLLFQSSQIADIKNRKPFAVRALVAISAFEHPTYSSSSVIEVEAGTALQATGSETKHWYEIRLASGARAYVSKLWVVVQAATGERPPKWEAGLVPQKVSEESSESANPPAFDLTNPVWADVQQVEIREEPQLDSHVLWPAPLGHALYSQQEEDEWIRVAFAERPIDRLEDLRKGWVPKSAISREQPTRDTVRRKRFIGSTPVPNQMRQLIMVGKIKLGMTPDMVRASWGQPRKSIPGSAGQEEWRYGESGPSLTFRDGRLLAWED